MDLSVFFAGTGGSVPSARRGLPATLIRRGGERILVDCGEGTQRQLVRSIGLADLDDVFITHFHADHWLGLPGMLKTFDLRERDRPLTVYGPPGLTQILGMVRPVFAKLGYPLTIAELEPGDAVRRDGYEIVAFPVRHRTPAYGYALVEDERPGRFDPELATRLGVAPGPDFGRLQRGETVDGVTPDQVLGPPRLGRKVVLSGDTAPCEATRIAAHEADLLVHESTFLHEDLERAIRTGHSTARQAAEIAAEVDVRMLCLNHLSTRSLGHEVAEEARATFERTEVPRDFDEVEIPFPERGAPQLVRWSERKTPPPDVAGPPMASHEAMVPPASEGGPAAP
jgi:ribonuclease Z